MVKLQRILLAIDFSQNSAQAANYALELVEKFDAELHLFHVLETHAGSTPVFGAGLAVAPFVHESNDAAMEALGSAVDPQWAAARTVVRATGEGSPATEIIAYAEKHDIDMIVMGTHGRSGIAHVLMGSVAEKVVRKAPCPVLTVRRDSPPAD